MKYFETLPKSIKTDKNGVQTVFTNIMSRTVLISDKLSNPLLFYKYDIQEGDTPEIIAEKYYGDPYRYWIILLSNNILDPQWEWPILNNSFNDYIQNKYNTIDPYADAHHYEKIITKYDSGTQTTTVETIEIGQDEFDLLQNSTQSFTFDSGTCTITTTKKPVSYFEYEMALNESRRSIKLLKKEYTMEIEDELYKLMK